MEAARARVFFFSGGEGCVLTAGPPPKELFLLLHQEIDPDSATLKISHILATIYH
jgi:hypothetical protein